MEHTGSDEVLGRSGTALSGVEAIPSVTVAEIGDPILVDEVLKKYLPDDVIAEIERSELIEDKWSDSEVFNACLGVVNTCLAVANTLLAVVQVVATILQSFHHP